MNISTERGLVADLVDDINCGNDEYCCGINRISLQYIQDDEKLEDKVYTPALVAKALDYRVNNSKLNIVVVILKHRRKKVKDTEDEGLLRLALEHGKWTCIRIWRSSTGNTLALYVKGGKHRAP